MSVLLSLLLVQSAGAAATPAQQPPASPNDQKIVCKTLVGTGSRLNNERVCMTKREWRRLNQGGEEVTREMQDQSSRRGPVQ